MRRAEPRIVAAVANTGPSRGRLALAVIGLVACASGCPSGSKPAAPDPGSGSGAPASASASAPGSESVNAFYGRGQPTFVLGTSGDDLADRGIANQATMIRDALFPAAPVVVDTAIDPAHWPAHPVVYGGPHVSSLVASLSLPFSLARGHLEIGGRSFDGDDIQIITVVPADPHHPEFLLYAGTGSPGIIEINSHSGGGASITIKDRFGILTTGFWRDARAMLTPSARRIAWRSVERGAVSLRFPGPLAASADEPAQIDAAMRGLAAAGAAIGVAAAPRLAIYFYPDPRSKQTLTGDGGDGTANPEASVLHVLAVAPRALEDLVAHEGTHVLAYHSWGPAGTPLVGEGLAVWAAGHYAGRSLDEWARTLREPPSIAALLAGFRKLPEAVTYPMGGLLVETTVALVGLGAVKAHLYPATASTWSDACHAAGTTPDALQHALDARLAEAR